MGGLFARDMWHGVDEETLTGYTVTYWAVSCFPKNVMIS